MVTEGWVCMGEGVVSGEITGHSVCLSPSFSLDTLRFDTATGQTSQQQQSKQPVVRESKHGHGEHS